MHPLKKIILPIFAVIVVLSIYALMSSSSKIDVKGSRGNIAVKVIAQDVMFTPNNRTFESVGTSKARLTADIYPAVSDEVTAVLFHAQQQVKKGDVLVQLDDREEKLAVRLAEVAMKDAQSLLGRYEKVISKGAVSESEMDSAQAAYDSARVALDKAKLDLEDRQVIAPFDGVVGIANINVGDRIDSTTLITGLDDRKILHVDFDVPEALAGELKNAQTEKQKITATTPAYPSQTFTAYISAQESRVNPESRALTARAVIENTEDLLRPGMSFATRWEIAGKVYPTVPEISVQWGKEGSFIWLIRESKAEKIFARVVARTAGLVLLDGDIREGDRVVVEGLQRLRQGVVVNVLNDAELNAELNADAETSHEG